MSVLGRLASIAHAFNVFLNEKNIMLNSDSVIYKLLNYIEHKPTDEKQARRPCKPIFLTEEGTYSKTLLET
jgi:hypothetical protein